LTRVSMKVPFGGDLSTRDPSQMFRLPRHAHLNESRPRIAKVIHD
jgi:hypothetical protein